MNIAKQEECPRCGTSKRPGWNYDAQICSCGYGEASAPPAAPADELVADELIDRLDWALKTWVFEGDERDLLADSREALARHRAPFDCTALGDVVRHLERSADEFLRTYEELRRHPTASCRDTARGAQQANAAIRQVLEDIPPEVRAAAIRNLSTKE